MSDPTDLSRLRIDRSQQPRRWSGLWWTAALLLALPLLYFAWRAVAPLRSPLAAVELGRVLRRGGVAAQAGVSANGYIVARRRAALSTDVSGRVVDVPVEEGDAVRAGEVVARLDTRELEAQRERAEAELERGQAAAELARLRHRRAVELLATGDGTQEKVDEAFTDLRRAEALIKSLAASLHEIAVRIENSTVRAPFDGIIIEKSAEVGEVVSAIGANGPGAGGAVATLVDPRSLEVQVELAQTSLRVARIGAPVVVYLDAYPDDALRGRVRRVWPTANRQKATVELRVVLLETDPRALPEMGVRVVFLPEGAGEPRPPQVLLPRRALLEGEKPLVFLYREGHVTLRPVILSGDEREGHLLVSSGLVGEELVVLDPPPGLRNGDAVQRKDQQ